MRVDRKVILLQMEHKNTSDLKQICQIKCQTITHDCVSSILDRFCLKESTNVDDSKHQKRSRGVQNEPDINPAL